MMLEYILFNRVARRLRRAPPSGVGALACAACLMGCARLPADDGDLAVPDREVFPLVSDALERRCATLDCHGSRGRNLRLYTGSGLRLDEAAVPGSGSTTEAEYDASYRSIVALEPIVLDAVVSEGGARPERLTLVRKARGVEKHAAGAVLEAGGDADLCLVSWLGPQLDEEACARAAEIAPPAGWPQDEP